MKKFLTILLMAMFGTFGAFAQTITTNGDVDFGTYSLNGKEDVSADAAVPIEVTISNGFFQYEGDIMGEITDDEAGVFYLEDSYYGVASVHFSPKTGNFTNEFKLNFYAIETGEYTARVHFYGYGEPSWEQVDAYANLKVKVISDAIVTKIFDFERINATDDLKIGDVVVFVSEAAGAVSGPLYTTYLQAITENVTIDAANGKAKVPETAQMFTLSKYSGSWQFTTTDTKQRLHLDITGKGAFTYEDTKPNEILANWGVSISSGIAEVSRPDEEQSFPVKFNDDHFKPYKEVGAGTDIALYKKVGDEQEPTAIENVELNNAARKIIRNGQIIIIRNGVEYSIDGKVL